MVTVKGAPGYEDFEGDLIAELHRVDGVMVCVIGDPDTKEIFVIESKYVHGEDQ